MTPLCGSPKVGEHPALMERTLELANRGHTEQGFQTCEFIRIVFPGVSLADSDSVCGRVPEVWAGSEPFSDAFAGKSEGRSAAESSVEMTQGQRECGWCPAQGHSRVSIILENKYYYLFSNKRMSSSTKPS